MSPAATVPAAVADTVTGSADLWCTYAALRTLRWTGQAPRDEHAERTVDYLHSRRNGDGGYAWSKGMPSDAWATFYCTQALRDLDVEPRALDRTTRWTRSTWDEDAGAFAMVPGQAADVWATHYATRTLTEVCREPVPDVVALRHWLGDLQTDGGGLTWSPAHRPTGRADVRACFYGVHAWRAIDPELSSCPWDRDRLVGWLQAQQSPAGGFRFGADAEVDCQWATYRATATLQVLGQPISEDLEPWFRATRDADGAFVRWVDYPVPDVWAAFTGVGSMIATGDDVAPVRAATEAVIDGMRVPAGGFTYRDLPSAADVLSVSAAALVDDDHEPALTAWLESCQLPNEGGVMYMPARGAEIRCTLWALAAGAFASDPAARARIGRWLAGVQNPDGGFGYWEGRASDLVSTSAAVELAASLLGGPVADHLDPDGVRRFVHRCLRTDGAANVPGGPTSARAHLQALRVLGALGEDVADRVAAVLAAHRVPAGGYDDQGHRLPDLLTSYEAVVAADRCGPVIDHQLDRLLDRLQSGTDTAWTPMAPPSPDVLAGALAALLRRRQHDATLRLPALTLS